MFTWEPHNSYNYLFVAFKNYLITFWIIKSCLKPQINILYICSDPSTHSKSSCYPYAPTGHQIERKNMCGFREAHVRNNWLTRRHSIQPFRSSAFNEMGMAGDHGKNYSLSCTTDTKVRSPHVEFPESQKYFFLIYHSCVWAAIKKSSYLKIQF